MHSDISTHAPLAGRDCQQQSLAYTQMQISTHAPLAGRDLTVPAVVAVLLFQPTRPLRGATTDVNITSGNISHISTHAPLAGRDSSIINRNNERVLFQPTRPLRGTT